jgi:Spy/CpxP family protein refolding chaperone
LDILPPSEWWHDYRIAEPLNLSYEQKQKLDQIAADQGEQEIERLERDTVVAARDFRVLLDSEKPASDDIIAAGQRLRSLRDAIIDRQVKLLAAERQVLTRQQWQKLQDVLRDERMARNRMNEGYPRRGRMGGRGPGRVPGWPY